MAISLILGGSKALPGWFGALMHWKLKLTWAFACVKEGVKACQDALCTYVPSKRWFGKFSQIGLVKTCPFLAKLSYLGYLPFYKGNEWVKMFTICPPPKRSAWPPFPSFFNPSLSILFVFMFWRKIGHVWTCPMIKQEAFVSFAVVTTVGTFHLKHIFQTNCCDVVNVVLSILFQKLAKVLSLVL